MNDIIKDPQGSLDPQYTSKIPVDLIDRKHVIGTIDDIFSSEIVLVCIEGDEGCGATTAMAQFSLEHAPTAFPVFLNPASKISYSADYVRLMLAEQIKLFLDGQVLEKDAIDPGSFQSLLFKLRSKLKGKIGYFVIDGLGQIPKDDELEVKQILKDVLPVGMDCFRFLVSGDLSKFTKYLNNTKSKPYQLQRFSQPETLKYFEDAGLDGDKIEDIYQACRGNPGKLSSIKRQLNRGKSLDEILNSSSGSTLDFIEKEFDCIDSGDEQSRIILGVITYSKQILSMKEISKICGCTLEEIEKTISNHSFLKITDNTVEFVSNSHRKHAESIFKDLQNQSTDLQIKHLIQDPNSGTALIFLPTYYQQKRNHKELISLLSNKHYCALLESTESMQQLKQRAEIGLKSALSIDEAIAVFQFSLQKALFVDLSETEPSSSEINALVSLEKPNRALSLASKAITIESRISLLAAYASAMARKQLPVDPEVMNRIRELYPLIDFSIQSNEFCEKLIDDLVSVDASLASDILEKSLSNSSDQETIDYALAKFRISASAGMSSHQEDGGKQTRLQIKNEALRNFTQSLTKFLKDQDFKEVEAIIKNFNAEKKIGFLKLFLKEQNEREGLLNLVSLTLDIIVKESAYTPKISDYADIAEPLQYQNSSKEDIEAIISRFDAQLGLIKSTAVSRDYVRLEIALAHAEAKYNITAAYNRILTAYFEISSLPSPDVKAECCANLLNALYKLDKDDELEKIEGMKYVINSELQESLENLLSNSADHYSCVENVIPAISKYDFIQSIEITKTINTESSRNKTYSLLARTLVSSFDPSEENKNNLTTALINICSPSALDAALKQCCDTVAKGDKKEGWIDAILPFTNKMESIHVRSRCLTSILKVATGPLQEKIISDLKDVLEIIIDKMPASEERNDICFNACATIFEHDKDLADKIYSDIVEQRSNLGSDGALVQKTFSQCLALVIRAFGAAMKTNAVSEEMINRLISAIERITCAKRKIALYNDLAIRSGKNGQLELTKRIVEEYCKPLLAEAKGIDNFSYRVLLVNSFPSLYLAHPISAINLLKDEEALAKDCAIEDACRVIRRKLPRQDPSVNEESNAFSFGFNEALDILNLIDHMDCDTDIYTQISEMCDFILSKKNRHKFTLQQKKEISDKILKLTDEKFPQQKNIKHDGYVITSTARAFSLIESKHQDWKSLCDGAEDIKNISDRAYVLIILSSLIPTKFRELKEKTFELAKGACQTIPSVKDRLGRLESLTRANIESNAPAAKITLKDAFSLSQEMADIDDAIEAQKRIINIADQIEPGYANQLIELLDKDPARREAKIQAEQEIELLKTKKDMADAVDSNLTEKLDLDLFPEAAWRNLGALLAGRIETKSLDILGGYLTKGASLGLTELYPALCWYIENAARKYILAPDVNSKILPLCESLLISTELAFAIVDMRPQRELGNDDLELNNFGIIIKPQDRDAALKYLGDWLESYGKDYIKICDPYFTSEDISLLKLILARAPTCAVSILTCAKNGVSQDEFQAAWRELSDQSPPDTYVMAVSTDTGKAPIHDRWILSKDCGLRIGTSFNGLGNKLSEMSVMREQERSECEHQLDQYFARQAKISGSRIRSIGFDI